MKNTRYIPLAAAVALSAFAVSCNMDDYEKGQGESADSYDIYFDAGQSGQYAFDLTEDIELTFTLTRNNTSGEVIVPLEIEGDNIQAINITPLLFLDGKSTAEITVNVVGDIGIQTEYEYVITIPAPEYSLIYGLNETSLTFSVIREDYEVCGSGRYTNAFWTGPVNVDLEYSEVLDMYRIKGVMWQQPCDDLLFKWDGQENVTFEEGVSFDTGFDFGEGLIYATPEDDSKYDPATRTFTFDLYYNIPGVGGYLFDPDTFTLNR